MLGITVTTSHTGPRLGALSPPGKPSARAPAAPTASACWNQCLTFPLVLIVPIVPSFRWAVDGGRPTVRFHINPTVRRARNDEPARRRTAKTAKTGIPPS